MKSKNNFLTIALILVIIFISGAKAIASSVTVPGSAEDPVVTKKYVDTRIDELLTTISNLDTGSKVSTGSNNNVLSVSGFQPVEIKAGRYLIGKSGTEIILRSGEALVVSKTEDGISDITSGIDAKGGSIAEVNHLMIIPRDDGRGFFCISDTWFMIKGEYTVN